MDTDKAARSRSQQQIAELERKLQRLPTKRFYLGVLVVTDLAIAVLITFAEKLQTLVR